MKMRMMAGACALAMAMCAAPPGASARAETSETNQQEVAPQLVALEKSLHKQSGDVAIGPAKAMMHLGQNYYFIGPEDARKVLVDAWGNPPEQAEGVLGMVLPAGKTVLDNVWGAVISYEDTGHVSDKDANSQDYDEVLANAREASNAGNEERKKAGYPTVNLVGWAQPPAYDQQRHALIWARDIRFGEQPVDSLNYDVRMLGRTGVLSLNMISDMQNLDQVRVAARDFSSAVAFDKGAAYADYDSSVDKTAEYGLAGLVAAGVGVAAVKKLGFLAIILGLGKKLIILVLAAGAALWSGIKKLFGRGGNDDGDPTPA